MIEGISQTADIIIEVLYADALVKADKDLLIQALENDHALNGGYLPKDPDEIEKLVCPVDDEGEELTKKFPNVNALLETYF